MPLHSKHGGNLHHHELKELLGLPKKLPTWGSIHSIWNRQGHYIRLLPQGEARKQNPGVRKPHRLQAMCNGCGCWFPAGRLNQHERGCKQLKDNTSI